MRLRAATAEAHARLDAVFSSYDLGSRSGYGAFLCRQAAALIPAELWLETAGVTALLPDWDRRHRRAAVLQDLAALGLAAPPPVAFTPPAEPAGRWGMLYVLEGSRLGAAMLARRSEAAEDPLVRGATAFLRHGSEERLWASFLLQLESDPDAVRHPGAVVGGARHMFEMFEYAALRRDDEGWPRVA